ncbi:hypothetical protein BDR07DRAFT_1481479 [Suillus spraguei]|nr:hypothetical protein BDR07DRAFT_1481479 [Suillus spraguei]
MSTTRYQTRSRMGEVPSEQTTPVTKAAPLPRANSESSLSTVYTLPGGGTTRMLSPAYSVNTPTRLYSDMVLARNPSMLGAFEATPIGTNEHIGPAVVHSESEPSSDERSVGSCDDQPKEWTTVQRKRRTRSPLREVSQERQRTSGMNQEQVNLVRIAESELTEHDSKIIDARNRNLNLTRESNESRGEGTSRDKGKAPDPRNWGNVGLEEEEVDLDAQRAALAPFRLARELEETEHNEQQEAHKPPEEALEDDNLFSDPREEAGYVSRTRADMKLASRNWRRDWP